jgi:hypothetical protein
VAGNPVEACAFHELGDAGETGRVRYVVDTVGSNGGIWVDDGATWQHLTAARGARVAGPQGGVRPWAPGPEGRWGPGPRGPSTPASSSGAAATIRACSGTPICGG